MHRNESAPNLQKEIRFNLNESQTNKNQRPIVGLIPGGISSPFASPTSPNKNQAGIRRSEQVMCSGHPGIIADVYCQEISCNKLICYLCALNHHSKHKCQPVFTFGEQPPNNQEREHQQRTELLQYIYKTRNYYINLQERVRVIINGKIEKLNSVSNWLSYNLGYIFPDETPESKELRELELIEIAKDKYLSKEIYGILGEWSNGGLRSRVEKKMESVEKDIIGPLEKLCKTHEEYGSKSISHHQELEVGKYIYYFQEKVLHTYNLRECKGVELGVDEGLKSPEVIEVYGNIYLVGDNVGYKNTTYIINISDMDIVRGNNMGYGKGRTKLVENSGYIYTLGMYNGRVQGVCEEYNIGADTWREISPFNHPRCLIGACFFGGSLIYAFGGYDGLRHLDSIELLDIKSMVVGWKVLGFSGEGGISKRRMSACVQLSPNSIFIFGGYSPSGANLKDAYVYKVKERKFKVAPSMLEHAGFGASRMSQCIIYRSKIYSIDYTAKVHTYNIQTANWNITNFP